MFLSCLTFPPTLSVLPLCVYSNSLPSSAPPRARPLVAVGNPSMWNKISLLWHRVSGWKGRPVYSQWPQPKQVSPQSSGLPQRLEVRLSQCQPAVMPRLFSVQPHSNHVSAKHSEEYYIRNVMAMAKYEKQDSNWHKEFVRSLEVVLVLCKSESARKMFDGSRWAEKTQSWHSSRVSDQLFLLSASSSYRPRCVRHNHCISSSSLDSMQRGLCSLTCRNDYSLPYGKKFLEDLPHPHVI